MSVESRYAHYDVVAVLSGLEPQRTLLEEHILNRYAHSQAGTHTSAKWR